MRLTRNLCELIGIIIGDGNIYRDKYIEITGDYTNEEEREYYKKMILPMVRKELHYSPPNLVFRERGMKLRINNKRFILFLKSIGIPTGKNKSLNVLIPNRISASWMLARRSIRGIFDTDGSIYFDKRRIYKKFYPHIELHIKNLNLIKQIAGLLTSNSFTTAISVKKSSLYLNGDTEVRRYLSIVGFSNKKHLSRILRVRPDLLKNIAL